MIKAIIPSLLTLVGGMGIVIQQALNANLRTQLNSAIWSAFTSYLVGLLCVSMVIIALREPIPSAAAMARIPWWAWSGGLFGAFFICIAILVVQQLGAATLIALLVSGQLLAAIAFDHFGWLGLAQRPLDLPRVIGVCLLIGGVLLIRR